MNNVTVSVQPELKKRMDRHEEVNWSAVARQAFEEKLSAIEILEKFASKSRLTEKDAIELGDKIKKAMWEKHYKKLV